MNKPIMTGDIWSDISEFQKHYGIDLKPMTRRRLKGQLEFIDEELTETFSAFVHNDPEELLDGLIDILVVTAGTIAMINARGADAWREVMTANLNKEIGVNAKRPNSEGVDLVKPEGWKRPDIAYCIGRLGKIMEDDSEHST